MIGLALRGVANASANAGETGFQRPENSFFPQLLQLLRLYVVLIMGFGGGWGCLMN